MSDVPNLQRTTEFVMSSVQAPGTTPVLFVEIGEGMISLANLDDIERLKRKAREAALDEVQEFVTGLLSALK